MNDEFKGRAALVTGGSRGIGKGIALALAERGADVGICHLDASEDDAKAACLQIEAFGGKAFQMKADLGSEPEVKKLFEGFMERFGRLDFLVNNAGTSRAQDIFEMTLSDWDFIIKTNLTSSFLCSKAAFSIMKAQGQGGRVVFISSMAGQNGALMGHAHYSATKAGVIGMVKTLARTGAPLGINVNAIAPGIIDTELLRKTHGDDGIAELSAKVPLKRLGSVREIGLAAAFLCGEGGAYVTGATLDVNGGMYSR